MIPLYRFENVVTFDGNDYRELTTVGLAEVVLNFKKSNANYGYVEFAFTVAGGVKHDYNASFNGWSVVDAEVEVLTSQLGSAINGALVDLKYALNAHDPRGWSTLTNIIVNDDRVTQAVRNVIVNEVGI